MPRFLPVNMAALPAPAAIQALGFEAILNARMAYFQQQWTAAQALDTTLPNYDAGALESDPVKMLQETDTYRETLVDARINDAVLATSLAYAEDDDLTVIGANFNTPRATGELDPPYRARIQLAFENLSIGGSYGGYRYQALQAAPLELLDVAVYGHEVAGVALGEVRIVCLGANASGVPSTAVLQRVKSAICSRSIRKVNDNINVVAANVVPYAVDATLLLNRGADPATVLAAQAINLTAYAVSRLQIGALATPFGIGASLTMNANATTPGAPGPVADIVLRAPMTNAGGGPFDAPMLTGTRLVWDYQA